MMKLSEKTLALMKKAVDYYEQGIPMKDAFDLGYDEGEAAYLAMKFTVENYKR